MFTKVVEAYDAWLKFLEIVGLGEIGTQSFVCISGPDDPDVCRDCSTDGCRISMTHLVIWIGPLCTLFLQMFYPLQSACQ